MTVLLPHIDQQRAIAAAYAESVGSFFVSLNEAYRGISSARQKIENFILGAEAEILDNQVFGLTAAIEVEEEDVNGGEL